MWDQAASAASDASATSPAARCASINHDVNRAYEDIAEFRGGLDRPLGGGSGRTRVTLESQRLRQYEERGDPREPVVIGFGLGDHPAQLGDPLPSDLPE